jgi:hypothetical protein
MISSRYIFIWFAIIFAFSVIGCSGSSNPVTQPESPVQVSGYSSLPVAITDMASDGSITGGMGMLGLFELHLNPAELSGELNSLRRGSLEDVLEVVDVTNFMQLAPCADCAKIKSVQLDAENHLVATIGIKHPFNAGDPLKPISGRNRGDLHVFNVEGVVISNATGTDFPGLGESSAGFSLLNSDGYSAYLDSALDEIYPTDASLHPYILHFDDYSEGNFNASNPMGFESVTNPPPTGNLVMAMGSDYDDKDYIFDFPTNDPVDLILAVECTYAVSAANKMQRFSPEYRVPQHNKKAASEVGVEIVSNELGGGLTSSTAILQISVVDISHGVPVGTALNEMRADSSVGGISVEVAGVTAQPVNFSTTPLSGTGHDPSDPLVYEGTISNSLGAEEGTYFGLVKVTDSYSPGLNTSPLLNGMDGIKRVGPAENPLIGLFAIDEFATYQVFSINVGLGESITVVVPNGGEAWPVGSDQEITWLPAGVPGNVKIEYSKDNFGGDINTIATGEPNDGSYMWMDIPDDPSDTVRVRITSESVPSQTDTSEADFSILAYHVVFSDEGVLPEMQTGFDDISPALCVETDGEIKMAYNCNKVTATDYAISYACKSTDGLNWTGFQTSFYSWGGVLANHGDNTKIVADNTGNSFRYLSLYYVAYGTWSTPFAAATELFPPPYNIDGAHVTTYISRAAEMIMDANEYIYIMGDKNNQLQFKKSEIPGHLTGGPSGAVWQNFPIYIIGQGYFSRARSIELAPNDTMYFVYYVDDSSNLIKLGYNTTGNGLTWDTSQVIYDGATSGTAGANNPGLDIDPDGEFHVTFVRLNGADNQLCYIHSVDGTTWTDPVVISEMSVTFNDDPICEFIVDSIETLATVWKGGDHIYVNFSMDGGQTWDDTVQVDSLLPENAQPDFIVTSDGIMHIAWAAKNGTNFDIHYRNAWLEQ